MHHGTRFSFLRTLFRVSCLPVVVLPLALPVFRSSCIIFSHCIELDRQNLKSKFNLSFVFRREHNKHSGAYLKHAGHWTVLEISIRTVQYFPILQLYVLMLRWTWWIFLSSPSLSWSNRLGIQFATCQPLLDFWTIFPDLQVPHLVELIEFWDQLGMSSPLPQQVSLYSLCCSCCGCLGFAPLQVSLCSPRCLLCCCCRCCCCKFQTLWELFLEQAETYRVFDTKFSHHSRIPSMQSAGTESWTTMARDLVCQIFRSLFLCVGQMHPADGVLRVFPPSGELFSDLIGHHRILLQSHPRDLMEWKNTVCRPSLLSFPPAMSPASRIDFTLNEHARWNRQSFLLIGKSDMTHQNQARSHLRQCDPE